MAVPLNLGFIEFIHPEFRGADCHRSWDQALLEMHASCGALPTAAQHAVPAGRLTFVLASHAQISFFGLQVFVLAPGACFRSLRSECFLRFFLV